MSSYNNDDKVNIPVEVPVFHNWDYPQERKRFLSIPDVTKAFKPPQNPTVGITLKDLINELGDIKVLNFEIGSEPKL